MIEQEINTEDKKVSKYVILVLQGILRFAVCLCLLQRQMTISERAEERVTKSGVSEAYQREARAEWCLKNLGYFRITWNLVMAAKPGDRASHVNSGSKRHNTTTDSNNGLCLCKTFTYKQLLY